jgi:hypothetical protein
LQQRRAPHAGEEAAVREEGGPGEARYSEDGNGALNLGELELCFVGAVVSFAVKLQGLKRLLGLAMLDEPTRSGDE